MPDKSIREILEELANKLLIDPMEMRQKDIGDTLTAILLAIELDEGEISQCLYEQGVLMNYSEDRKRVAQALASAKEKVVRVR